MNRKEWKEFCKVNPKEGYRWYNKARNKLLSKEFESDERTDKDARVIHHLIETEEQRKYNDEHYELFGFEVDENGNESFEYGKYVVFWTKEHHIKYHNVSEVTRKKLSLARLGSKNHFFGKTHSDESRLKISISQKRRFKNKENHPMYGKHHSSETRKKLSDTHKGKKLSQEHKLNISISMKAIITDEMRERASKQLSALWQNDEFRRSHIARMSGENHPFYGKPRSEETKEKISASMSGENHPNYGKHLSDETKAKIGKANSVALLGKHLSDETKKKMSESRMGHEVSDDTRLKISTDKKLKSQAFSSYKSTGGTLSWNEFQSAIKAGKIDMYIYIKCDNE